jgi:hypothetical protein
MSLESLARRIKSGKYTDVPWELMRAFWPDSSEQQALRKLQHWAKDEGIEYEIEAQTIVTGKLRVTVPVVVFSYRSKPS